MQNRFLSILLAAVVFLTAVSCTSRNTVTTDTFQTDTASANGGAITDNKNVCTIMIECSTVFSHTDILDPAVAEYIPDDGVILVMTAVAFEPEDTVADILRRVCDQYGIALETSGISGALYVEGIGHLYEFDCGEGSGWMYRVNGEYPNFGCDSYTLSPGDSVEWKYTCDFGADVGDDDRH